MRPALLPQAASRPIGVELAMLPQVDSRSTHISLPRQPIASASEDSDATREGARHFPSIV